MSYDPITGPIAREKFRELVTAPHGQARKEIQKIDPLYGREPGEKFEFEVIAMDRMRGRAVIKASSQEEADKMADDLTDDDFDWNSYGGDLEITSVEPLVRK